MRSRLRWLAVPIALALVVLALLATRSESSDEFVERTEREQAQSETEARQAEREAADQEARRAEFEAADRIVIQTPDGAIEISADGDVRPLDGDGNAGTVVELRPDPDGDIVGYRVEDGQFVPVRVGESTEGATLLGVDPDGQILLLHPDGSTTVIGHDGDGFVAEQSDGTSTRLEPGQQIDFGDGTSAGVAGNGGPFDPARPDDSNGASGGSQGPSSDSSGPAGSAGLLGQLLLGIVVIGLVAAVGWLAWRYLAGRTRDGDPDEPAPDGLPAPTFAAAHAPTADHWAVFEAFLQQLREHPDPSEAVLATFAYAERGAGRLPTRVADATPGEWLRAVRAQDPDLGTLLRPLVNRYSAVRFGDIAPSREEQLTAVDELDRLVRDACSVPT